jgi:hypothetical protein|tara:strand:- start:1861 stop:2085 length:225 start_codon:yes stop_codon:yes gene_type:complete
MSDNKKFTQDSIVDNVINKFIKRSNEGMINFGMSMEDNPKEEILWIEDAQEELMDAVLYLEKLKQLKIKSTIKQ